MHHLIKENSKSSFEFIVKKKQVNKYKTLHTSVLFQKVESIAISSMTPLIGYIESSLKTFDLDIKNKAILNDELIVTNRVHKLNSSSLELCITVVKKSNHKDLICKAYFGYSLKKAS